MAGAFFAVAGLFAADVNSTNETVTSPPVFVPDTSHSNDPLPDGILAWDELMKKTGRYQWAGFRAVHLQFHQCHGGQHHDFERASGLRLHDGGSAAGAMDVASRHERPD